MALLVQYKLLLLHLKFFLVSGDASLFSCHSFKGYIGMLYELRCEGQRAEIKRRKPKKPGNIACRTDRALKFNQSLRRGFHTPGQGWRAVERSAGSISA